MKGEKPFLKKPVKEAAQAAKFLGQPLRMPIMETVTEIHYKFAKNVAPISSIDM